MSDSLDDVLMDLLSVQFTDNTSREAEQAREETCKLVKRAHAAGAAEERARIVAVIGEYRKEHRRNWNGGDTLVLLALDDLLKAVRQ